MSNKSLSGSSRVTPEYRWVNVTQNAAFAPRDGTGALVFKNRMWLLGGWSPEDKTNFPLICNNEVWSSADGVDWTLEKPGTFGHDLFDPASDWEGRHAAGYAVLHDKMWIFGGDCNQGHYQFDVWYSADGKTWTHVNKGRDVPWGPRVFQYSCVFQDKIWIMGGQTVPHAAPAENRFYGDLWNSCDGVNWTQINPKEPYWRPRSCICGSVIFKNRIWLLGGGAYWTEQVPEPEYYNDVWSSEDGTHWEQHLEHAPWLPRVWHNVAVFDDKIWVLEGCNPSSPNAAAISADTAPRGPKMSHWVSTCNLSDIWYSADGEDWHELPTAPWPPRHASSVFVYNNALWIVAGNNMERDVWKLTRADKQ